MRVPRTARRSNQATLKEINAEYSLEELLLKLKFQNWPLGAKSKSSSENILTLGKTEDKKRRRWQRMRWLVSITN